MNKLAVAIGMLVSFLSVSVYAQAAAPELNHFTVEGISFDYPAGYSVADESTTDAQQFTLTRKGSSAQLTNSCNATLHSTRRFVSRNPNPHRATPEERRDNTRTNLSGTHSVPKPGWTQASRRCSTAIQKDDG